MPKGSKRRQATTGTQPLVPCSVCGKAHYRDSSRAAACQERNSQTKGVSNVPRSQRSGSAPEFLAGELSRTGDGDHPAGLPMPHAVFSQQMLPKDVPASHQPATDRVPSTQDKSKRLIAKMRAASRSAVSEWRRRGIEPTQQMLFSMDVYNEEAHELLEHHLQASEDDARRLAGQGLSIPLAPHTDQAFKQCFHAVATAKGLAVSPVNLQRIIARAAPNTTYSAREFIAIAIGLRALADTNPLVRDALAKPYDGVEASDLHPVVNMLRNYAAFKAGRVRFDEQGRPQSEVGREHLAVFGPEAFDETQQALRSIEREAATHDASVALSITDDHTDLLALPVSVAGDIVGHGLTYREWRENGWDFPEHRANEPKLVLLEPALVRQRADGITDEIIRAMRPEVAGSDEGYTYAPDRFLAGPGVYAVGGMSSLGAEHFGSDAYKEQAALIQRLYRERNLDPGLANVAGF